MFGKTKANAEYVETTFSKLKRRLFGPDGKYCLNTSDDYWPEEGYGILGRFERQIEELQAQVAALTAKKQK